MHIYAARFRSCPNARTGTPDSDRDTESSAASGEAGRIVDSMMSQKAEDGARGPGSYIGLTRIRVNDEAVVKVDGVDVSKIHPAGDTRSNSSSTLPAWLAASKVSRVCACATVHSASVLDGDHGVYHQEISCCRSC